MTKEDESLSHRELRANGWVPGAMAYNKDAKPVELISYPWPNADTGHVTVFARNTPGEPETLTQYTIPQLRLMPVKCPNCKNQWVARMSGELRMSFVACDRCHREYSAKYDEVGNFIEFSFHGEALKMMGKPFKAGEEDDGHC